ncbi:hypothetical protein [Virgibacillus litoralis]|uniref:Uncharacterized protein n=1 Tax=Virgibacillus litoralis TaxID=578221 RepID=A0ABS4HH88_9BACI|nr:hypothetical protein [Virgibacillus litoralis]MBP1950292.1 hypothetical protein [Virgibacillus litoralis]
MKAKVLQRFRDKDSNKIHEANHFYESNEKRIKELQDLGYLGEVKKEKQQEPKQEPPKQNQSKQKKKKSETAKE